MEKTVEHRRAKALAEPARRKRCSLVWLVLMLGWMAVIFFFSTQQGDASSASSSRLADLLMKLLGFWYDELSTPEQQLWYGRCTLLIRKTAHMCEYAVLAILAFFWLKNQFVLPVRKNALLAFLICTVFAASDEFHQTFVSGRSGKPMDVAIDATGAALAILLLCFCVKKKRRSSGLCAKIHNRK